MAGLTACCGDRCNLLERRFRNLKGERVKADPFGGARPWELVLAEKGVDWRARDRDRDCELDASQRTATCCRTRAQGKRDAGALDDAHGPSQDQRAARQLQRRMGRQKEMRRGCVRPAGPAGGRSGQEESLWRTERR